MNYDQDILGKLLDKYESSKSYLGNNRKQQRFAVKISAEYPAYADHADFDTYTQVNEAVALLMQKKLVDAQADRAKAYETVFLNMEILSEAYRYLGRVPRKEMQSDILGLLEQFEDRNDILCSFCAAQRDRIVHNKPVEYFQGDLTELEQVLTACAEALKVKQETFLRDFSVRIFHDSKVFERISGKVAGLLYQYGDFSERDRVLGELNLVKNPTYLHVKGAGAVDLGGQRIVFDALRGDLAFSTMLLDEVENIALTGKGLITIENLTSFHTFSDSELLAVYLGGYHNEARGKLIRLIYRQNPLKQYLHFGDIDAGGFSILEHLRRRTGVDFRSYRMDVETLKRYQAYTRPLTANDRVRLERFTQGEFQEVVRYMLENNCKLEQEAVQQ